jgi:hypothetical protein
MIARPCRGTVSYGRISLLHTRRIILHGNTIPPHIIELRHDPDTFWGQCNSERILPPVLKRHLPVQVNVQCIVILFQQSQCVITADRPGLTGTGTVTHPDPDKHR